MLWRLLPIISVAAGYRFLNLFQNITQSADQIAVKITYVDSEDVLRKIHRATERKPLRQSAKAQMFMHE